MNQEPEATVPTEEISDADIAKAKAAVEAAKDCVSELRSQLREAEKRVDEARVQHIELIHRQHEKLEHCSLICPSALRYTSASQSKAVIRKQSGGGGRQLTVQYFGRDDEEMVFSWDKNRQSFTKRKPSSGVMFLTDVPEKFIPKAPNATASTDEAASTRPRTRRP